MLGSKGNDVGVVYSALIRFQLWSFPGQEISEKAQGRKHLSLFRLQDHYWGFP